MLDSCFQQLAASPTKGRDCSHVVFYRQKRNDEIEIVRVLHGRMDIETKFSTTPD